jgi:hypothetical protein
MSTQRHSDRGLWDQLMAKAIALGPQPPPARATAFHHQGGYHESASGAVPSAVQIRTKSPGRQIARGDVRASGHL